MNPFWTNILNHLNITLSPLANALIFILLGFIISILCKNFCTAILKRIRFHNVLDRIGFNDWIKNNNYKIEKFIGLLIQTFFILVFCLFASEVLQLHSISVILLKIILYYPNIFISIIIFIISIFAIDFSQKIVIGTKNLKRITYSRFLAKALDWSIRVLMVLAILYQLEIIPQLVVVIFAGIVLTISLSIGISLGLAAKEPVSRLLKEIRDTFKFFN